MGNPTGFLEYERQDPVKRSIGERLQDYREIERLLSVGELQNQAGRCMDCGIPFCHACGCPVQNLIPDFNDLVYRDQWRYALEVLHSTNNLPEVTGRVCPAPCEPACTLSINQPAVTIRQIELQLVERGWEEGWIQPQPAAAASGHRVAVVGSGPAGLAAAQQLARAGHEVVVFERHDRIGGILRYGIPDFKLEKWIIDRRLEQLEAEGVRFETRVDVGEDISIGYLSRSHSAVVLAGGARVARDLPVPGRDLEGIHFAMPFLIQQNRRLAGDSLSGEAEILAGGKHVIIIGGGDTGSDCIGTSLRQGAESVTQLEIMPKPPPTRDQTTPWPQWPYQLRTSSSQQEGGTRQWEVMTKKFLGRNGRVTGLRCCKVSWDKDPESGQFRMTEVPGSEFDIKADLVLLAMGFTMEGNAGVLGRFGVETDDRHSPVLDRNYMTSVPGVFVAGDLGRGASLVVRAIFDGRQVAAGVDAFLAACGDSRQP